MHDIFSALRADTSSQNDRSEAVATVISQLELLKDTLRSYDERGSHGEIRQALRETVGRLQSFTEQDLIVDTGSGVGLTPSQAERVKSHVFEKFGTHISSNDLADLLELGRNRFGRMFYQSFGMTPMRFVKSVRVTHAKRLLAATDISIDEIAQRCGFPDQAHLNRVFSGEAGMSPRRWRICSRI